MFHIVGHRLQGDFTEETTCDLLGFGTKVRMRRQQTLQNDLGLARLESFENRRRLR